ncbi:MAG: aspartate carbamoyltransferase [Oscillospiraceae bacterium]|jgi:aspartate carbamoyltransferase catalytic subunit|nr:aspartate carbamoyltransferase [Oscillospiraceae bacterium]
MTPMRKLVNVADMNRDWWDDLYTRCRDIIARPGVYADSCRGKILASMFYEPSTRTNFSFQAAAQRLGAGVFGFSDPVGTSASKGETLADTIRMTAAYSSTIVIRSPQEGSATAAALYSEVPIINAGDGGHSHPTQTLTDLTTIAQKRGNIGNFRIGLCGDLKHGRTVHSLVEAMEMFPNISFYLISPHELRLPDYVLDRMKNVEQSFIESESLIDCIPDLDILYMTRIQRERFKDAGEYRRLKDVYVLTKKMLDGAKKDMQIMHPLPRYGEIATDVDNDPRAAYFDQARYGMLIRMALLLEFMHLPREHPSVVENNPSAAPGECVNPACITRSDTYLPRLASRSGVDRCGYCDKKVSEMLL